MPWMNLFQRPLFSLPLVSADSSADDMILPKPTCICEQINAYFRKYFMIVLQKLESIVNSDFQHNNWQLKYIYCI